MSDVCLMLAVFEHSQQLQLIFKNHKNATEAYQKLVWKDRGEEGYEVELVDDFGQTVYVNRDLLVFCVVQHLHELHQGQAEIAMAQGHAQTALNRRAASDPSLRFLTAQGAPVGLARS